MNRPRTILDTVGKGSPLGDALDLRGEVGRRSGHLAFGIKEDGRLKKETTVSAKRPYTRCWKIEPLTWACLLVPRTGLLFVAEEGLSTGRRRAVGSTLTGLWSRLAWGGVKIFRGAFSTFSRSKFTQATVDSGSKGSSLQRTMGSRQPVNSLKAEKRNSESTFKIQKTTDYLEWGGKQGSSSRNLFK